MTKIIISSAVSSPPFSIQHSTFSIFRRNLKVLGIGIALIQLLDIFVHAVTDQLEILRVTSNAIILLWLALVATGKFNARFWQTAVSSIGTYLTLNVVFLAFEGVTNAEQGGELRVTLFLLICLTTVLSILLAYLQGQPQ